VRQESYADLLKDEATTAREEAGQLERVPRTIEMKCGMCTDDDAPAREHVYLQLCGDVICAKHMAEVATARMDSDDSGCPVCECDL
jgi:hypothetical protein